MTTRPVLQNWRRELGLIGAGVALTLLSVPLGTFARRAAPDVACHGPFCPERLTVLGILVLVLAAAMLAHRTVATTVRACLTETTAAVNLAMFRIVVFATLICTIDPSRTIWLSALPTELLTPPTGLHAIFRELPVDPSRTAAAAAMCLGFSFAAMIGLFSRTSAFLATLLGVYVLGIQQSFGRVTHYHHLLWFGALLAASPCGDALSLDSLRARRPRPPRSTAYARPLLFAWILMGVAYLFPGIWKAATGGIDWVFSDNLRNLAWRTSITWSDWTPPLGIDHPRLYQGAAAATLLFETSFIFLALSPRLRWIAVGTGLLFHTMSGLFLHIPFWRIQACLVGLLDWDRIFRAVRAPFAPGATTAETAPSAAWHPATDVRFVTALGTVFLAINVLFGSLGISAAWPFACYPTFARPARPEAQTLVAALRTTSGDTTELRPIDGPELREQMTVNILSGLISRLLETADDPGTPARLEALWDVWTELSPPPADLASVAFYKDTVTLDPAQRAHGPLRRQLLATLDVRVASLALR